MAKRNGVSGSSTARAVIQKLESLERAGVEQLGKRSRRKKPAPAAVEPVAVKILATTAVAQTKDAVIVKTVVAESVLASAPAVADTLAAIQQEVAACTRCTELACTRTQTVFGVGNPRARLCFLGEAPGADEDKQGEPFVGRAGQLLTRIIEACTLSRSDVYILNVLKCRPPGNRTPLPDEVENCRGYLNRQLALIQPEFICCLGAVAARTLLNTDVTIGKLRGQIIDYRGINVMCTYHPAYLLRNPAAKKEVWEDMKALMRKMGIELGKSLG